MNRRIVLTACLLFVPSVSPPPEAHAEVNVESFLIESFDPQQNLFSFIGSSNLPGPFAAGGEAENWVVSVNLERLRSLPDSIVLNLPGQAPETLPRIRSATRAKWLPVDWGS